MTQELITKYTSLLDDYLTDRLVSSSLDSGNSKIIDFSGAGQVKVPHIEVSPLGKYDRDNGYTAGTMTVAYDELKLAYDRGSEFTVDEVEDEETAFVRSAEGMKAFMEKSVAPQVDAIRFGKYATNAGTKANGTLTADTVIAALDAAEQTLGEAGALEGARLYMSYTTHALLKHAIARQYGSESAVANNVTEYNGIQIERVRSIAFTQNLTVSDTGYVPGANGINFIMANPMSVQQIKKHEKLRVFDPDTYQKKNAWLFQYRLFHDAFVLPQLEDGIYAHTVAAQA